jgi:hypothetical protein
MRQDAAAILFSTPNGPGHNNNNHNNYERQSPMNTTHKNNVARRSFTGRIAGAAVAGALLLGAPALATLAAAPASADKGPGIVVKNQNGGGFAIVPGAIIVGNGKGQGAIFTPKGSQFFLPGKQQVTIGNPDD